MRKLNVVSLGEKSQASKDLQIDPSNKEVAKKYAVSKKTISTWIKIKKSDFFVLKNNRTTLRDSD